MLVLGANLALELLGSGRIAVRVQESALARPFSDMPGNVSIYAFVDAPVTGITECALLVAVQQSVDDLQIMNIGRCRLQAVDQPGQIVDTDVHLHSEKPLVALACLVRFRVPLAFGVLGRARRRYNAGIDDAAFAHYQAVIAQVAVDLVEYFLAQLLALQDTAEIEDRGLVGQRLLQAQSGKPAHRLDFVKRVFHAWIAQAIQPLHAENPQHGFQWIRRAAVSALRIVVLQLLDQPVPRNQGIHSFQELFPPRIALLLGVFGFGKADLVQEIGSGLV